MAADAGFIVQSIAPGAGPDVAVTVEVVAGVGSVGIQWVQARSSGQPIGTVGQQGAPWATVGSVAVQGSLGVGQLGTWSATVAGSVFAGVSQVSSPWAVFPGSTGGFQGFVVASVPAPVTVVGSATVAGSVFAGASQVSSPWMTQAGSSGQFQGFVVASIPAPVTVIGSTTVAGSVFAAVAGSLSVAQMAVWSATVAGSVFAGASQVSSPWITQAGSTGAFTGFSVVSVVGGGAGGGPVTQTTSPWITQAASSGVFLGFITASVPGGAGGGPVTQVTSPWVVQQGSTGVFAGFVVASVVGGGAGGGPATQVGSPWGVITQPSITAFQGGPWSATAVVASATALVQQSLTVFPGGAWSATAVVASATALIQGSLSVFPATSWSVFQGLPPWTTTGTATIVVPSLTVIGSTTVAGSVFASVAGSLSVAPMGTWSATVAGSVFAGASQVTSPWITQAGSSGAFLGFLVASVVGGGAGGGPATQVGSPWGVITQTSISVVGSVNIMAGSALPVQIASGGNFLGFLVASVVGGGAGGGPATQVGSPWGVITQGSLSVWPSGSWSTIGSVTVAGSVFAGVSQVTSPWITQAGSSGAFLGFSVVSVVGGGAGGGPATQVGSPWGVITQPSITAFQGGVWSATAVVASATALIQGSLSVFPATSWTMVGSTTVAGSVFASIAGSLAVAPMGTWSATVAGSVFAGASQVSSPWAVFPGSTGAFQGFMVTSLIGTPTVQASVTGQLFATTSLIGQPTVQASVAGQLFVTASVPAVVTVIGSTTAAGSVFAAMTASLSVAPMGTWSATVAGSVFAGASQVNSPWQVFVASTGLATPITHAIGALYENHQFVAPSYSNLSFINSFTNHVGSCSCARSAFSFVPVARNVSIRNVGASSLQVRFNVNTSDLVSLSPGETLYWDFLKVTDMFMTCATWTTLRVALFP